MTEPDFETKFLPILEEATALSSRPSCLENFFYTVLKSLNFCIQIQQMIYIIDLQVLLVESFAMMRHIIDCTFLSSKKISSIALFFYRKCHKVQKMSLTALFCQEKNFFVKKQNIIDDTLCQEKKISLTALSYPVKKISLMAPFYHVKKISLTAPFVK